MSEVLRESRLAGGLDRTTRALAELDRASSSLSTEPGRWTGALRVATVLVSEAAQALRSSRDKDASSWVPPVGWFEPDIYGTPDEKGYLTAVGRRTYRDLMSFLEEGLGEALLSRLDSFGHCAGHDAGGGPLPPWNRVAAFAVTGGSEGWYVRVECFSTDDAGVRRATCLVLGKTFEGWDVAHDLAGRLSRLLGA